MQEIDTDFEGLKSKVKEVFAKSDTQAESNVLQSLKDLFTSRHNENVSKESTE